MECLKIKEKIIKSSVCAEQSARFGALDLLVSAQHSIRHFTDLAPSYVDQKFAKDQIFSPLVQEKKKSQIADTMHKSTPVSGPFTT